MLIKESSIGNLTERRGSLRPGVLKALHGPFMEFDKVNENERLYSRSLIENRILNNPNIQEKINSRCFFGEGNHPDRNEVLYSGVTHAISELKLNEETGHLEGVIEILDTPVGRIIKTLSDYGAPIGISARASGEATIREGVEYINEDTYDLHTFDLVTQPGFSSSLLNESKQDAHARMLTSIQTIIESLGEVNPSLSIDISDSEDKSSKDEFSRQPDQSSLDGVDKLLEENEKLRMMLSEISSKKVLGEAENAKALKVFKGEVRSALSKKSLAETEAMMARKEAKDKVQKLAHELLEEQNLRKNLETQMDSRSLAIERLQEDLQASKQMNVSLSEALKQERFQRESLAESLDQTRQSLLKANQSLSDKAKQLKEARSPKPAPKPKVETPQVNADALREQRIAKLIQSDAPPQQVRVLSEARSTNSGRPAPNTAILNKLISKK